MQSRILLVLILAVSVVSSTGCDDFSKKDVRLLETYGGLYIPSGEGPAARMAPVDAVMLDSPKRALTDAEFAEVFPAVKRMDPYRLHIRGEHTISDKSIALLNQLRSVRVLDTSGTTMTVQGLKELKVSGLKQLYVSPERFTEEEANDLQQALKDVEVSRWRSDGPRHPGSAGQSSATKPATTRASSPPGAAKVQAATRPTTAPSTSQPSTRPAILPSPDAATLSDRLGQLDAITFRCYQSKGDRVEKWDVVITDRTILARFEAMRRGEWRGWFLLYIAAYDGTARFGETEVRARLGVLKLVDQPFAIEMRGPDGRSLFIETGQAARELDKLVDAEALRQRPAEPTIERPG